MTDYVEFITEHGTYLVTPEDKIALTDDLRYFGTAIVTFLGDGAKARRIAPQDFHPTAAAD